MIAKPYSNAAVARTGLINDSFSAGVSRANASFLIYTAPKIKVRTAVVALLS